MEFKEVKKEILQTEYAEWFKTQEFGFSSIPCDFHKKFVGIEEIYNFFKKEQQGWNEYNELEKNTVLNESKAFANSLIENLDSYLQNLLSQRTTQHNFNNNLSHLLSRNQEQYFIANSPITNFIYELGKRNHNAPQGALQFLIGRLYDRNWTHDKNELLGVLAAYEFTTKEYSEIFSRKKADFKTFSKLRDEFDRIINESEQIKTEKSIELEKQIETFKNEISEIKINYDNRVDEVIMNYEQRSENFHKESVDKINDLEETYQELLMLKKPAEYWDQRASELKKSANKWLCLAGVSSFIGLVLFTILAFSLSMEHISSQIKNPAVSIRWSLLSLLAIALIIFLVRTFTKLTMSSYHLYRDAQERKQLTYLYLALKHESNVSDGDRHIILQSLFSRSDTGLLKEDSGPTMPLSSIDKFNQH
jgi:hypothetical protein